MPRPYPLDVYTDETLKTGKLTIVCETQGQSDDLRELAEYLTDFLPLMVFRRYDVRANVPPPPPIEV